MGGRRIKSNEKSTLVAWAAKYRSIGGVKNTHINTQPQQSATEQPPHHSAGFLELMLMAKLQAVKIS
jgi:hypothetical protein